MRRLTHFFKLFQCFQPVEESDFHVATLFTFDFRNIEKVKLFNFLFGDIVSKNQLYGITDTAESKTVVACRNVAFVTFPLLVDFFNFFAYVLTLQQTYSTFLRKKISGLCCSFTAVTWKTVVSAKEFLFVWDFFDSESSSFLWYRLWLTVFLSVKNLPPIYRPENGFCCRFSATKCEKRRFVNKQFTKSAFKWWIRNKKAVFWNEKKLWKIMNIFWINYWQIIYEGI